MSKNENGYKELGWLAGIYFSDIFSVALNDFMYKE